MDFVIIQLMLRITFVTTFTISTKESVRLRLARMAE